LQKYKIDNRLLQKSFNPLKPICENPLQKRDRTHEYRGYEDYLKYLKIVGNRIIDDYKRFQLYRTKNKIKSSMPILYEWEEIYILQLDIESFVIFCRILLNRVGILVEELLNARHRDQSDHSFTAHKGWFQERENTKVYSRYAKLLKKMNWYDQNLSFIRDKIIEHGGILAGSIRSLPNSLQYRRINKDFGLLSNADADVMENLIDKYGKENLKIRAIKSNPATMFDKFLDIIMKYNIKLDTIDKNKVGNMVKKYGMTIDIAILSKHIREFLEKVASLFAYKTKKFSPPCSP
jgi:hypothetical protein